MFHLETCLCHSKEVEQLPFAVWPVSSRTYSGDQPHTCSSSKLIVLAAVRNKISCIICMSKNFENYRLRIKKFLLKYIIFCLCFFLNFFFALSCFLYMLLYYSIRGRKWWGSFAFVPRLLTSPYPNVFWDRSIIRLVALPQYDLQSCLHALSPTSILLKCIVFGI